MQVGGRGQTSLGLILHAFLDWIGLMNEPNGRSVTVDVDFSGTARDREGRAVGKTHPRAEESGGGGYRSDAHPRCPGH